MKTTKITVKVYEPLLNAFNQKLNTSFIKRDAFLNYIIKKEISNLALAMKGLKQTNLARRYISGQLKRLGTKTINVVVDKETATDLKFIIEETNMVRDSFINRLMIFVLAPDQLLEMLELPTRLNDEEFQFTDSIEISPLLGINTIMENPLSYLHFALENYRGTDLYRVELPKKWVGMSCYLDNSNIPDTEEYYEKQKDLEEIMNDLVFYQKKGENNV